jgi:hypothetical protein
MFIPRILSVELTLPVTASKAALNGLEDILNHLLDVLEVENKLPSLLEYAKAVKEAAKVQNTFANPCLSPRKVYFSEFDVFALMWHDTFILAQ